MFFPVFSRQSVQKKRKTIKQHQTFKSLKKQTLFSTNPTPPPVVPLLLPGLHSRTIARTVSSELLSFCFFSLFFSFLCRALD